jgi:hypothetical protein
MRKLLAGKAGSWEPRHPGRDAENSPSLAWERISLADQAGKKADSATRTSEASTLLIPCAAGEGVGMAKPGHPPAAA